MSVSSGRTVHLASPRGFCAGVDRAIEIVEAALRLHGPPIWVRHEIVHNRAVVDDLRAKGARFVDDLAEVPLGGLVIFSAHGVSPEVRVAARRRGLRVVDATCPLVSKVHLEVMRFTGEGCHVLLVGHRSHVEVQGALSHAPGRIAVIETLGDALSVRVPDSERVAVLTQTTLSVDEARQIVKALRARFPKLRTPRQDDICYATQNRQRAVRALAHRVPLVLVVGAANSSNTRRLVEVARAAGAEAYRIDDGRDVDPAWLAALRAVGITAGASAPESSVQSVVGRLRELGFDKCEEEAGFDEGVSFPLPPELRTGSAP
jgi:4-hydroxy-3-methylbut-2-enyl diphosphate reductase